MIRPLRNFLVVTFPLVAFIVNQTTAQSTGLQLGQMVRQTVKESWADLEPLGKDESGVYYLSIPYSAVTAGPIAGGDDYFLFLVNDAAELIKRNVANFKVDGLDSKFEFSKELGGKTIVFNSVENRNDRTVSFYAFELDKASLQLSAPKKIVELSFAALKKEYERASFRPEVSQDKSKLLISYSLVDDEGVMLTFGYVLLNSAMKEIYKWNGSLDMSDGVYLFDEFKVSNKGEVYLQTRFFLNEKDHDKNTKMKKTGVLSATRSMEYKKNYEHRIVRFDSKGTAIIPIPNKTRFYDVLVMEIAPDGNLVLIGFYSPLEEEVMPIGATCLKLNVKSGSIQESVKEFGNAFEMPSDISNKNNGLAAGKDQYLKYRFVVSDIKFNKNGGYTLIGERNVLQTKRSGNVYFTVNHLDDLAVVDVSSSGTVTAVHKVEKSQQVEGFGLYNGSYYYTEHKDKKILVFANLGKTSNAETVLVTLNADGKQQREVLFSTKDAEITIRPKESEIVKGRLITYGNKNNRYVRWASKSL